MTAQLGCNRKVPEDCERAGRSLESGSAGMTDAARARGLRRIALTLYVKQCESSRVSACLRLAEMYEVGELVQANPKNAEALRVRAKMLCSARPDDADCRR
jgi:TPR repeat protein